MSPIGALHRVAKLPKGLPATLVIAALAAMMASTRLAAAPFSVNAPNLNGEAVTAPRPDRPTIILFAFRHGDQSVLDGWRTGLRLRDDDPSWFEVAYIAAPQPVRPMILGSLRRTFASPAARGHMIPAFGGDPNAVARAGLPTAAPLVAVFAPSGSVAGFATGAFDAAKRDAVMAALAKAER